MDETSSIKLNITKGQLRALAAFAGGVTAGVAYAHSGDVNAVWTSLQGLTGLGLGLGSAIWSGAAWATTTKETAPAVVNP